MSQTENRQAEIERAGVHRRRLARMIGENAVAILAATPERNRNNDVDYPYRANSDFRYLTGFLEPEAIAVIAPGHPQGAFTLFVRERDPAAETWTGKRAGTDGAIDNYRADAAYPIEAFDASLAEMVAGRDTLYLTRGIHPAFEQRIAEAMAGLESQGRGHTPPATTVSLNTPLHEMRLVKSDDEIALMRRAAEVSAAGHEAAMHACEPGVAEYQLAATLHHVYGWAGMHWAYPTIVGAGENGCILHYTENTSVIEHGDLVLIDSGAENAGYAGDITRTFPANGRFTSAQRALYDIVLAANEAGIAACQAGALANAPHLAARDVLIDGLIALGLLGDDRESVIESEAYRVFFMHGTSHFLGMEVHDVGAYKQAGEWRALEPGMVLTVEPGLYVAPDCAEAPAAYRGMGIRIEDDVLITRDGPDVLTGDVVKKPDDIETLMSEASPT